MQLPFIIKVKFPTVSLSWQPTSKFLYVQYSECPNCFISFRMNILYELFFSIVVTYLPQSTWSISKWIIDIREFFSNFILKNTALPQRTFSFPGYYFSFFLTSHHRNAFFIESCPVISVLTCSNATSWLYDIRHKIIEINE